MLKKESKTPGELLSTVKDDSGLYKRSKHDILLYSALILFIISTITGIILIFLIALGLMLSWILSRMIRSKKYM